MREIKFRFWEISSKTMIDWRCVRQTAFNRGDLHMLYDLMGTNPDIVKMQFTGLQDKNGKDIYEGDIVKFHYFYGALGDNDGFVECEHELTGVIKWAEFGWALESIKGEHWKGHTGYEHGEGGAYLVELASMNEGAIHEESFEVIGNQYESPELIDNK